MMDGALKMPDYVLHVEGILHKIRIWKTVKPVLSQCKG